MFELAHDFTSRKISPWGGLKYFQRVLDTSGIRDFMKTLPWPERGSNRGYEPTEIVEGFMTSVVLGARRLEHAGMLRSDQVVQEIFGWKKGMASASTFSRFFSKFSLEQNDEIFPQIMRELMTKVPMAYMTLDIDSSIITRYGDQEGAEVGYNPDKPGRKSHHPLMAFCDERKMVVNAWMRTGNSASSTDAIDFLKETFSIVSPDEIGLVRGDAGFANNQIMSYLEGFDKPVPYLFRAKLTTKLKGKLASVKRWATFNNVIKGAGYAEIAYQAHGWQAPRRIVLVRKPKQEGVTRQKELFPDYEDLNRFEYAAYVTNLRESMISIHRRYNQRGEAENRIKELKYDFGMDGFSLQKFAGMEAAFRLVMVAFNLMTIFKQAIMMNDVNHRMSTVRFQCIAIGSYLVSSGRKKTLKLSAEGKRRHFLEHLFENLEVIRPPYTFPNA